MEIENDSVSFFDIFNMKKLSPFERLLFLILAIMLFASAYLSLYKLSESYSVNTPLRGGLWKEATLSPASDTFNPTLAKSPLDLAVNKLVYSGLLKENGLELEKDIAKNYEVSSGGKEYTFSIRDDVYFHDGKRLTAHDIIFTYKRIQDPESASPLRPSWEGVKFEIIDDYKFKIILPKPYAPFIENLTIGILPKHLWDQTAPQDMYLSVYNKNPIGSGPYKFVSVNEKAGSALRIYKFEANESYYNEGPYISSYEIHKYPSMTDMLYAWEQGEIDAISAPTVSLVKKYKKNSDNLFEKNLLRTFAVFLNPSKNKQLANKNVRQALNYAINKKKLVSDLFFGHAEVLKGPLPDAMLSKSTESKEMDENKRKEKVAKLMQSASFKKNESGFWQKGDDEFVLQLSLTDTSDEMEALANFLQKELKNYGFKLIFKKYDLATLNNKVIRERDFEALLFGIEIGRVPDLYQFWHSSQRDDPGLNISRYKNKELDKILEDLRVELDKKKRLELLAKFQEKINEDVPAIFLFSPRHLYLADGKLQGYSNKAIGRIHERFADINKWHLNYQKIWTLFK